MNEKQMKVAYFDGMAASFYRQAGRQQEINKARSERLLEIAQRYSSFAAYAASQE